MIKTFVILFPPYENEIKIWKLLGKWVYWVWVRFYPKSIMFLWVFRFLKPYSPNHPTQPTFLGFLGWVWRVFWVYPTNVHPYKSLSGIKSRKNKQNLPKIYLKFKSLFKYIAWKFFSICFSKKYFGVDSKKI